MRQIKFRVWDNIDQEMYPIFDLLMEIQNPKKVPWMNRDWELMQFTGLKDKNGKEIYEGDIIQCIYQSKHLIFPVIFSDGAFRSKEPFKVGIIKDRMKSYEVIGNIYENPELLKENKR